MDYPVDVKWAQLDFTEFFTNSEGFGGLRASHTSFATYLGAGFDCVLHKNVVIRLLQTDLLITRFGNAAKGDARISAGIVFRFGSK